MPAWPGSLPQRPLVDGHQERPPDLTVRTQMDVGPPKVRRRSTVGIRAFTMALKLTAAQVQTLDDFYLTTLEGGSLRFDWVNPRTGAAAQYRLLQPPQYRPLGALVWRAELALELLP